MAYAEPMRIDEIMGGAEGLARYQARMSALNPQEVSPAEVVPPVDTEVTQYASQRGIDPNTGLPVNPLTPQQSYSDTLKMFQGQIDAYNSAIAQERARIATQYQAIGKRRLGSQRAIQAATGTLGQVSGMAATGELERATEEERIAAERVAVAPYEQAKQGLYGKVTEIAMQDLKDKQAAQQKTAEDYLTWKKERTASLTNQLSIAMKAAILNGTELSSQDISSYASKLNLPVSIIKDQYSITKKEVAAEDAKAKNEALKAQPDMVREYEYAKSQGYTGSFTKYQNEDANRKARVAAAGVADQQTVNTVNSIKSGLDDVLDAWSKVPDNLKGQIQGRFGKITGVRERNKEVAEFEAAKGIVGMQLTRLFEKGVISDADRNFYMSLMANLNQSSYELASAANEQLKQQLDNKVGIIKDTSGLTDEQAYEEYKKIKGQ